MSVYLEMTGVEKTFPNGVRALCGANLAVRQGEIHALVGENAAGKSTLMNILYGTIAADAGEIRIGGVKRRIFHPADAIALDIGMVHQHFKLVPDFTILENIILGSESRYTNLFKRIDYLKARGEIDALLSRIDVKLDLDARIDTISIGLKSKVEIVKALFRGAKLLILDEPTTVLAPNEVDSFFDFLRSLRDAGCTMIYISHRMKEIFALTDSITVLRKGRDVVTVGTREASMEQLSAAMLGYEAKLPNYDAARIYERREPMLDVRGLSVRHGHILLEDIGFSVGKGEILGIAGIEGNGQVELADSLIGLLPALSGSILLDGEKITPLSIRERRARLLSYVPDDRMKKGLAINAKITENCIMGHAEKPYISKRKRLIAWKKTRAFALKISSEYKVEGLSSPDQRIGSLSGGNMQKVIVGRELIAQPRIAILAQPTAGVDFNAQRIIHERIKTLQGTGCSFLLISEDLDELIHLSDRILVLYRGKIVKEFPSCDGFDITQIGFYMTGVKSDEKAV